MNMNIMPYKHVLYAISKLSTLFFSKILKKHVQGTQNGIEIIPSQAVRKPWIETVKMMLQSITQEPLGLFKLSF